MGGYGATPENQTVEGVVVLRFAELGIRTVVDLRTASERAAEPDNLPQVQSR